MAMKNSKPIQEGFHSLTPMITISGASRAVDFYKKAFGAVELNRMMTPDGKYLMHAELKIGDSIFMIGEEMPEWGQACRSAKSLGGTSVGFYIYVEDVDSAFKQATSAGAKVDMPVKDMFWGDRMGQVVDPFGQVWALATHVEDVSQDEMSRRAEEVMTATAHARK